MYSQIEYYSKPKACPECKADKTRPYILLIRGKRKAAKKCAARGHRLYCEHHAIAWPGRLYTPPSFGGQEQKPVRSKFSLTQCDACGRPLMNFLTNHRDISGQPNHIVCSTKCFQAARNKAQLENPEHTCDTVVKPSRIEDGSVYLPTMADWLDDLKKELMAFPSDTYDDQVNSMPQALNWIALPCRTGIRWCWRQGHSLRTRWGATGDVRLLHIKKRSNHVSV